MFREYLRRTYQAFIRGRKRRAPRKTRTNPGTVARLAVDSLEHRTLLSTLSLTNGALVYGSNTSAANILRIIHFQASHRYSFEDVAEHITLVGNFVGPSGNNTHVVGFGDGNIGTIALNLGNQGYTVIIDSTQAGVPVAVNMGNGTAVVNVGGPSNLNDIQGPIHIHGGLGTDSLNIYDQLNSAAQTFSLGANSVSRSGAATITYTGMNFVTIDAGNGNNTYNVGGTEASFDTILNTGDGHDVVNVDGTGVGGTFTINEGRGGIDVNLGATLHNLNNLHSTVHVNGNSQGVDNLTVDDQSNSASQTFTLNNHSITRSAAGMIQYNLLNNLSVLTGTGGATVNVLATNTPTAIVGHANGTTVNIGNAGSVQQVLSPLTITDPPFGAFATVNVDDFADTAGRTVTLDTVPIGGANFGRITGLAPAPILYKYIDTGTVTVQTGSGSTTTVNVLATGVPVNLIAHGLTNVSVGNVGSVQAITSPLTIRDQGSFATINVDDSADAAARTATLDRVTIGSVTFGRITGLAPAAVEYAEGQTNTVTVQTGVGAAIVNVQATSAPVILSGHSFNTTVNVGDAGSLQGLHGFVQIFNPPSFTTVNVDDSADGTAHIFSLDTITLSGQIFGRIGGLAGPNDILYKYADTNSVTIQTGTGANSVNVRATGKPVSLIGSPSGALSLFASDAANTWNIRPERRHPQQRAHCRHGDVQRGSQPDRRGRRRQLRLR
jgi:hypothetical protein